jgi:hypothetical protein
MQDHVEVAGSRKKERDMIDFEMMMPTFGEASMFPPPNFVVLPSSTGRITANNQRIIIIIIDIRRY